MKRFLLLVCLGAGMATSLTTASPVFAQTPKGKKASDRSHPKSIVIRQVPRPVFRAFDKRPFKGNGKPVTTKTGLKYEDMTVGKGATAVPGKICVAHYTGSFTNGERFDSSRGKEPFSFDLGAGQVIRGWEEGMTGMKVGGRRRLIIPAKLGYGAAGASPIPPNTTMVFDVELMDVR